MKVMLENGVVEAIAQNQKDGLRIKENTDFC